MVHETTHVSTIIDRAAADVYAFVADPRQLSTWAAGLADQDVELIDGQWIAESPMGRVVVEFVPANNLGVVDHDVTLPDGTTVRNPMRVLVNADGCDVVFTVHRRPGMSDGEFAADVAAVTADLATLRSLLER